MNIKWHLDKTLASSPTLYIDDSFKGLFVSDFHMGIGDKADDFKPNSGLCLDVVKSYSSDGYMIFVLGDAYELWENSDLAAIKKTYPDLSDFIAQHANEISGNHDQQLFIPTSYILHHQGTNKKILVVHGHQGDFFCDEGYPFGKLLVRYGWRNLQMLGFKDPTTAQKEQNPQKHDRVRKEFREWAREKEQTVIFGHTHFAESDPPYYWNCGSWVGDGGQAAVIVGDEIKLKFFG